MVDPADGERRPPPSIIGRNPMGRDYILIIPGERYNEIVARETAVFAGAGLLLIGGAAAVTRRRRPS